MTSHILHHLRELQTTWRRQDFTFTGKQQEEYDILVAARRQRVHSFYEEDRVFKGSRAAYDKELLESEAANPKVEEQYY